VDDDRPERRARGRSWKVCRALIAFGIAVLIYGAIAHYTAALYVGGGLILIFGAIGAGARKIDVGTDAMHIRAEFDAPPPPKDVRRIYLPRGWGSKSKKP
jgi:hypothetical protein